MHFFKMEGAWHGWMASLYDAIVAAGINDLYDAVVEALLSDLPAGSRILDLGCGSGQIAIRAARRNPQAFVLALDLSFGQVARARSRGRGIPNLSFGVADSLRLPLTKESLDIVLSAAMIKHLPDRRQGLDQMRCVCREGGSVWVIEVDRELAWEDTKAFVERWKWVLPGTRWLMHGYFYRFVAGQGVSVKEMKDLFGQAGFASVKVQKTPGQPFVVGLGRK
jgi:ubiquinone/menaquinone biosynthesis C-methylase UbiE